MSYVSRESTTPFHYDLHAYPAKIFCRVNLVHRLVGALAWILYVRFNEVDNHVCTLSLKSNTSFLYNSNAHTVEYAISHTISRIASWEALVYIFYFRAPLCS